MVEQQYNKMIPSEMEENVYYENADQQNEKSANCKDTWNTLRTFLQKNIMTGDTAIVNETTRKQLMEHIDKMQMAVNDLDDNNCCTPLWNCLRRMYSLIGNIFCCCKSKITDVLQSKGEEQDDSQSLEKKPDNQRFNRKSNDTENVPSQATGINSEKEADSDDVCAPIYLYHSDGELATNLSHHIKELLEPIDKTGHRIRVICKTDISELKMSTVPCVVLCINTSRAGETLKGVLKPVTDKIQRYPLIAAVIAKQQYEDSLEVLNNDTKLRIEPEFTELGLIVDMAYDQREKKFYKTGKDNMNIQSIEKLFKFLSEDSKRMMNQ